MSWDRRCIRASSKEHGRQYELVDGKLKWGQNEAGRFEFDEGLKFKVSYQSPLMTRHKGAVGVYKRSRVYRDFCLAFLDCLGKEFSVHAWSLVPYDGPILPEHKKLISPSKKTHLLEDGRCACKCDSSQGMTPPKLAIEEFMTIPDSFRCANCNRMALKLLEREDGEGMSDGDKLR